jgi:flagellar biosynthesis protein FlhF
MNARSQPPPPPGTYRFVVGSAAEAVATIQARLGSTARVISVQAEPRPGLGRWLRAPRFAVVAELPPPAPPPAPGSPSGRSVSAPDPAGAETRLAATLRRAGFSDRLLGRLEAMPGWRMAAEQPLQQALVEMGREIHTSADTRPARPLPARAAFFGASGSGSTTALCKWLSREVFTRAATGQVWKVEFERPNPAPALGVFCEALGVPLEHYVPGSSTADRGFLLVDLPGLPPSGSPAASALAGFLDREQIEGRVLVLNAAYTADAMRAAGARGRELGATHLVLTHLDEVTQWGRLWEFLLEGELSPLFLSSGPALTGDIETEVIGAVLRRTLPGS